MIMLAGRVVWAGEDGHRLSGLHSNEELERLEVVDRADNRFSPLPLANTPRQQQRSAPRKSLAGVGILTVGWVETEKFAHLRGADVPQYTVYCRRQLYEVRPWCR